MQAIIFNLPTRWNDFSLYSDTDNFKHGDFLSSDMKKKAVLASDTRDPGVFSDRHSDTVIFLIK